MDTSHHFRPHVFYLFSAMLVVAALYLGRALLMPLALAALFTFLLNPLVKRLVCWRMPRVASVLAVTLLCFSTLALIGWLLGGEIASLAEEIPNHRQNIHKRVDSLKQIGENPVILRLRNLVGDIHPASETPSGDPTAPPAPAPAPPANGSDLNKILNALVPPVASALGTAAVVILFTFFMLLRLDDISRRFVRLVGLSRLTLTTKAVDEATERVGRYLLMQVTINGVYGILLATGLALIGLPYVVLWGALAAMFRFIPYLGPWMVAVLPIGLSLAVFEGWTLPLSVAGLIVTLELVTNMIVEPMLYGHSAGVSDFALLLAIAFWTWVWGGIGLILATPLTVCIVVFCKYIPSMDWVDLIMGENPAAQAHLHYYQHHLADDETASQALLDAAVRKDGIEKSAEKIVIPAIALTRAEEASGKLTPDEAEQMYEGMRSAFTLVSENDRSSANAPKDKDSDASPQGEGSASPPKVKVLGRALQGEADALALEVLASLLPPSIDFDVTATPILSGELVQHIEREMPAALCIGALPPRSHFTAGILCRRLRSKLPDLRILVCRWNVPEYESDPEPLLAAGATWVASTLHEARTILENLTPNTERSA